MSRLRLGRVEFIVYEQLFNDDGELVVERPVNDGGVVYPAALDQLPESLRALIAQRDADLQTSKDAAETV